MKLHTKILIGLISGAIVGLAAHFSGSSALLKIFTWMDLYGRAFIKLVTMIIVPLVVASLMVGVASLGDLRKLGSMGGRMLGFVAATTLAAAAIGIPLSILIKPGAGIDRNLQMSPNQADLTAAANAAPGLADTLLNVIPSNPISAAASGDLLGLIFFTVIFAAATGILPPDKRRAVLGFFDGVNSASMIVIAWAMKLAPTAVFCLIASVVARFGIDVLRGLIAFCGVVVAGLIVQVLVTYGLSIAILCRMNPVRFFQRIAKVTLMGFSTSSSSATLPVSVACAENDLGISNAVAAFVLPLGATLNKSGSALYKTCAVMFITQVFGVSMGPSRELMLILAATVSAMSTAGVPGSGMVSIVIVLQAVGLGSIAPAGVALVAGVDRILDMARTSVNVTGNMVCCTYVARNEGVRARADRAAAVS